MRVLVLSAMFLVAFAAAAEAQWDPDLCWAEIAHEPVSYFVCPCGNAGWLSAAFAEGGATVDGTITLHMLNFVGDPLAFFPAEDLWLDSSHGDLAHAVGGTVADYDTDLDGITIWQLPLRAGGISTDGATLRVLILGQPLEQPGFLARHNSPDTNGDLHVNLADLTAFAGDYFGVYAYRSDYNWDGAINLTDLSAFATHYGHEAVRR